MSTADSGKKYFNVPDIKDYCVSTDSGFLPSKRIPCKRLSNPYYERWEHLATNVQTLLLQGSFRKEVLQLETLSLDYLANQGEEERACMMLSFIGHGYIWGGPHDRAEHILPKCVAVPWVHLSNKIGLFPVLTYTTTVIYNFCYAHECKEWSRPMLDSVHSSLLFTDTKDEEWFYLVSLAIEGNGGACVDIIQRALSAMDSGDDGAVTECLLELLPHLKTARNELERMYEHCQPQIFFQKLRKYLAGWENMTEDLPNGVFYEGCPESDFPIGSESELEDEDSDVLSSEVVRHVTSYGQLSKTLKGFYQHPETKQLGTFRKYAGASAGQSPLIHLLDTFLCIEHHSRHDGETYKPNLSPSLIAKSIHPADGVVSQSAKAAHNLAKKVSHPVSQSLETQPIPQSQGNLVSSNPATHPKLKTNFFHEMRRYMSRKHRQYLRVVRKHRHQLRPFVKEHVGNARLVNAFNDCIIAMKEFRSSHIQMVTRYVVNPARKAQQEADGDKLVSPQSSIKQALLARGTGGTDVMPLLKSLRNETIETMVKPE